MKAIIRVLCLIFALLLCAPLFACAPQTPQMPGVLTLAQNGKAQYRIVYGADGGAVARDCAQILGDYLSRITGADFPIYKDDEPQREKEIRVGATNRDDGEFSLSALGAEGYLVRNCGGAIVLRGGGVRGLVYGAYQFLEKFCGVRYYTPEFERVPHTPTLQITLNEDYIDYPLMEFRDSNWRGLLDPVFCEKLGVNVTKSGQDKKLPHGGVSYAGWYVHTLGLLYEGKHTAGKGYCLSDESVFQTVLSSVRRWLAENPKAQIISVSQNDGSKTSAVCGCASCQQMNKMQNSSMGTMLHFVNRIADAIKDEYPSVKVDTLAYNYTQNPPAYLTPRDNVIIRMPASFCCLNHTIENADENSAAASEKKSASFKKNLQKWSDICEDIYVWHYATDFTEYLSPLTNLDTLRADFAYFYQNNVRGIFAQGISDSESAEFGDLRAYLTAKLMWNPLMDDAAYDALVAEFMLDYYGAGYPAILDYIDLCERTGEGRHYHLYEGMFHAIPAKLVKDEAGNVIEIDRGFVDEAQALWDRAASLAERDAQRAHIAKSRIALNYYELALLHELGDRAAAKIAQKSQALFEDLKTYHITRLSERYAVGDKPDYTRRALFWFAPPEEPDETAEEAE